METPKPFLNRIFPASVRPTITEVWQYGTEESEIYGGFDNHQAIDFAVPTGTPVLAAADGLALASYYELPVRYPGNFERTWKGEPIFWGFGLFVIIMHDNDWLTVYGHLHGLEASLKDQGMYVEPIEEANGDLEPPILKLTREDIGTKFPEVTVKAGQVIGYSGITGMGLGKRTYDDWKAGQPYRVNDEEHVHFAISSLTGADIENAAQLDPFGIYGTSAEQYPAYDTDWSALPKTLWLQ